MSALIFKSVYLNYLEITDRVLRQLVEMIRSLMVCNYKLSTATVSYQVRTELIRLVGRTLSDDEIITIDRAQTLADIAQKIGSHREAVTHELYSLERQGIIRCNRTEHKILGRATLWQSIYKL